MNLLPTSFSYRIMEMNLTMYGIFSHAISQTGR